VRVSQAPSDRELIDVLRTREDGPEVLGLSRRPYRYATSAPLEEVQVHLDGGGEMALILKDLARERLLGNAPRTKPSFLYEPRREIETYRRIIGPAGVGPRCFGTVANDESSRYWLLIEKVEGVELWQVGELEVWEGVATWLGGFHAGFEPRVEEVQAANPHLLEHSEAWFRSWGERARSTLEGSAEARAIGLSPALDRYEEVIGPLARLPRTFVHGELYPSNVLVVRSKGPVGVYPVDWEMAAIGPGLIDLAALVGGWDDEARARLVAAYLGGLSGSGQMVSDPGELAVDLARCRLHLAVQWLGWSTDWEPPEEHAHDWLGEALALARELELA
jgi:Ser/Thr protein kinase RdoA (MazF antagonist)